MSKTAPYFPFYPDDWLNDECIFSIGLECEGAYIRLLSAMWKHKGSVPDKSNWCCNVLRCKPAKWIKIRKKLLETGVIILENERLSNQRLLKELNFFNEKSQKNARNASKRWSNHSKTDSEKPNKINKTSDAVAVKSQCYTDTDTDSDSDSYTDTDIKEKEHSKKTKKRFFSPAQSEVIKYSLLKDLNTTGFFDYYESNGWMVGKNKMKDWQASARGWSGRQSGYKNTKSLNVSEKPKFVRKPSKGFLERNQALDESVIDGECKRIGE